MLSMTGFGRAEIEEKDTRVWVEVKSVNNRFRAINIKSPQPLGLLEQELRELVQRYIARGTVEVVINWELEGETPLTLNLPLAKAFRDALGELKDTLHLGGEIDISLLAALPGVIKETRGETIPDSLRELIKRTCEMALAQHQRMREAEGERIRQDITERIHLIDEVVQEIEKLAPLQTQRQQEKLKSQLDALLPSKIIDEQRLAMEIVLIAAKSDITEECVRLHSHNTQFLKILEETGPVGKKLDFLLQEINREANTLEAKASDTSISYLAMRIKEEAEKIREQVRNVE